MDLKGEINKKEESVKSMDSQIHAMESQLQNYQTSIKQIESTYDANNIPPNVSQDYENSINSYNGILPQFNQLVSARNEIYASYEVALKEHNDLVEQYNRRS